MKKFLIMLCLAAATVMSAAAQEKFPMITIPEDVTDPLLRAKYLSDHFWENVDFETASDDLISNGLSELIPILRIVDYDAMTASWAAAVKQAEESKTGVAHLLKVSRSVLNDPTLGSYDEDMYRALLHAALVSKKITKADKEPFQRDLVMLEVNNAGSAAIDFEITGADSAKSRLSDVESPITVLFLYEPGAVDSKLERFRLSQARIANYLMQAGGLKIVAMACTSDAALWEKNRSDIPSEWVSGYDAGDVIRNEGLYDLRVMPRLYLLDEKKVVLLKNTNTDGVEEYLYDVLRAAAQQQQAAAGQTAGGGSDASTDAAAAK